MNSTEDSDLIASVQNLQVYFDLEHNQLQDMKQLCLSAVTHPLNFLLHKPQRLNAIDDMTFEIKKGMRLGIVGTNASGKTTLCRCLAKMIVPQKGNISVKGKVLALFDSTCGIMPELTGRENLHLLARLFFPEIKNIGPIVDAAIEFSELGAMADVTFKQYSSSMKSRLILSLVSSQESNLIILDDVFNNVDKFFQNKFLERIKPMNQNNTATVFVTDSQEQIRDFCSHLMVLKRGKIVFLGKVETGLEFFNQMEQN